MHRVASAATGSQGCFHPWPLWSTVQRSDGREEDGKGVPRGSADTGEQPTKQGGQGHRHMESDRENIS